MEEVKILLERFFEVEARTATLKRIPDLDSLNEYNKSLKELNAFFIEILQGAWGHEFMDELDDEDVYEMLDSSNDDSPRQLFKISNYNHGEYGGVWVAFISSASPDEDYKILSDALFLIKEQEKLKIARVYRYSDYDSDGLSYEWKGGSGYRDLTFESLEGPIAIERFQEPEEDFDGLKHYNDDI
jgi:hypothetical protein